MLNRVVLVGRLTKDPDFRKTPADVSVATFTLAVNRTFANAQGEREADFLPCIVWRKQADTVNMYLRKGSLVGVDGRIQTRNYEGQDGKRVYVTEIVAESVQFLEPKGTARTLGGDHFGSPPPPAPKPYQNQEGTSEQPRTEEDPFANHGQKINISEDDLPF